MYMLVTMHTIIPDWLLIFQIMRRQVDQFAPGQWVPSCQLSVEWTKEQENPTKLVHRVKLVGAKEPFNFFSIQSPALSPPPQGTHLTLLLLTEAGHDSWSTFYAGSN